MLHGAAASLSPPRKEVIRGLLITIRKVWFGPLHLYSGTQYVWSTQYTIKRIRCCNDLRTFTFCIEHAWTILTAGLAECKSTTIATLTGVLCDEHAPGQLTSHCQEKLMYNILAHTASYR